MNNLMNLVTSSGGVWVLSVIALVLYGLIAWTIRRLAASKLAFGFMTSGGAAKFIQTHPDGKLYLRDEGEFDALLQKMREVAEGIPLPLRKIALNALSSNFASVRETFISETINRLAKRY